ncbi:AraC family transcriptional regulator [Bordetella genomosp. 1]|uniref:AraC family transcriptional regulator n=2 Tax=Bordetella genomosp. 1 TaxID=1395607 RepID=A0A261RUN3_9BORD|nr:AraC family transcriptional regulator [Bordetella genomosp. 1]OZI69326.1 AraC family transcriptional regulator [Bordetella genomosp. 1]
MLLLVREGLVLVQRGDAVWPLHPGRLGWVPPQLAHEARWFGRSRGTLLYVRSDACASLPAEPRVWSRTPLLEALLLRLTESEPGRLPGTHAEQVYALLCAELALSQDAPFTLPLPRERRLLELALRLLDDPADPSDIETWAHRVSMSARTLMRRFRLETGVTLGQWRQQARLLRALEFLAHGQAVTDVALAVGYESTSAFIGSFRASFGVTPSQYHARLPPA